jgi:DNA-binding LacI/PurR family transcriptional regulator
VPEDLSVIGFDDIPQASWGAYRLTTFRQDPVVTADQAIRLIEWCQAHPDLPSATLVIEAPLVLKETAIPTPGFCAGE